MRRTKDDMLKTRTALLEAGLRVLSRDGYAAARLEAISAEAGVTRGAFYWHFRDKAELLAQIENQHTENLDELVRTALAPGGSPLDTLRRLLAAVVNNFHDDVAFRQYIDLTWHKLDPGLLARIMPGKISFVQGFLDQMETLLALAQKAGEVRVELDLPQVAYHLSCLINGFYRLYFAAPDRARDKERTMKLFSDYLASLEPDRGL